MRESAISTSHHYYLLFFSTTELNDISHLVEKLGDFELIENSGSGIFNERFYHVQREIDILLGSPKLLQSNISKDEQDASPQYWYDFYLGEFTVQKQMIFFICFPYKALQSYLLKTFDWAFGKAVFHQPKVDKVLEYIQNRGVSIKSVASEKNLLLDITKYTAEIKDEVNADRVSLIGINPVKSSIYSLIKNDSSFIIKTSSLKLHTWSEETGEIDLLFDRFGNYRFWISKGKSKKTISIIPSVMQFMKEVDAIKISNTTSSVTILNNEEE